MNSKDAVLMLLGFGGRMDRATDRGAACLAETLGNKEIAQRLRLYGDKQPPTPCPERKTGDAPLLSFLTDRE